MKYALILIFCLSLSIMSADILILTDLQQLTGKIMGYSKNNIYFKTDAGKLVYVVKTDVKSIEAPEELTMLIKSNAKKFPSDRFEYMQVASSGHITTTTSFLDKTAFTSVNDSLLSTQDRIVDRLGAINSNIRGIWISMWAITVLGVLAGIIMSQK